MCWRCDLYDAFARREYSPETRAAIDRGQDRVRQYMEQHGVNFPEAVEALAEQRRHEFAELLAGYAERNALDDGEAVVRIWCHLIEGPGEVQ